MPAMARDRHQQHQDAVRVYKGETVFDWDSEPADERASAFVESTQYGQLWAPSTRSMASSLEVPRPRPPRTQGGVGTLWIVLIVGFAVAAGVLIGYVKSQQRPRVAAAGDTPTLAPRGA
jgi:hypothetical protein